MKKSTKRAKSAALRKKAEDSLSPCDCGEGVPAVNLSYAGIPEMGVGKMSRHSFLTASSVLFSVDEWIEKLKRYLDRPEELVTGPRSTGTREDTVTRVKERCGPDKVCPLKEAEMEFTFDDYEGNNLQVIVKITWQYDCCNIYNADASFIISDKPDEDVTVIMTENYSIPEKDPVELKPCTPCQPKCLRVQLSLIELVQETGQVMPGTRRKVDIDVTLCPSGNGLPKVFDNTSPSPKKDDFEVKRTKNPVNRSPKPIGGGQ